MPRRGASGTKGLYKKHNAQCTNEGDPTRCDCAWWGKYKGIRRSLAQWSGQSVDPFRKAHAATVFNRLKVLIRLTYVLASTLLFIVVVVASSLPPFRATACRQSRR